MWRTERKIREKCRPTSGRKKRSFQAQPGNASVAQENPSPMAVMSLATKLEVHPAIIAGRVRYERRNYRLLSQFVGTGEIRRHFGMTA